MPFEYADGLPPDLFAIGTEALTRCAREVIELARGDRPAKTVPAWRLGELAVHNLIYLDEDTGDLLPADEWTMIHLPTGCSFKPIGYLPTVEAAAGAMVDVAALIDWREVDAAAAAAVRPAVEEVFVRWGATRYLFHSKNYQPNALAKRLNGYGRVA